MPISYNKTEHVKIELTNDDIRSMIALGCSNNLDIPKDAKFKWFISNNDAYVDLEITWSEAETKEEEISGYERHTVGAPI